MVRDVHFFHKMHHGQLEVFLGVLEAAFSFQGPEKPGVPSSEIKIKKVCIVLDRILFEFFREAREESPR